MIELGELVGVYSDPDRDARFHAVTIVVRALVDEPQSAPQNPLEIVEARPVQRGRAADDWSLGHVRMLENARLGPLLLGMREKLARRPVSAGAFTHDRKRHVRRAPGPPSPARTRRRAARGCTLLGGVDVKPVSVTVEKPSNVAIYLSVSDSGEPISNLTADNFALFENEQTVPILDSQLTLLDKDVAAVHHTVLLVDMSGKLDDEARRVSARGAAGFVQKVRRTQSVSVFAFDGSSELVPIGEFERGTKDPGPAELEQLTNFSSRDPSRNLNGALLEGMKRLDGQLMAVKKPVRIGTVVVLSARSRPRRARHH